VKTANDVFPEATLLLTSDRDTYMDARGPIQEPLQKQFPTLAYIEQPIQVENISRVTQNILSWW